MTNSSINNIIQAEIDKLREIDTATAIMKQHFSDRFKEFHALYSQHEEILSPEVEKQIQDLSMTYIRIENHLYLRYESKSRQPDTWTVLKYSVL